MFDHLNIFQLIAIVAIPAGALTAVLCWLDRPKKSRDPEYLDPVQVVRAVYRNDN